MMVRQISRNVASVAALVAVVFSGMTMPVAIASPLQDSASGPAAHTAARTNGQPGEIQRKQYDPATQTNVSPMAPPAQTAREEQYRDQILDYWQQSSQRVKNFKCSFRRYGFDSGLVNHRDANNRLSAASIAVGEIFFSAPQHARYEVKQVWQFAAPPKTEGGEADYKILDSDKFQEKWICDGATIYDFDYENKRLYESEIPKDMQGPAGLAKSPIPFLFGANRNDILNRYWVRVVTPQGTKGEYWLEAYPKRAADAQSYSKLEIVIAEEDFLPKAMHMYSSQYDPSKGNFGSTQFEFYDRKVNVLTLEGMFGRPTKPMGWERSQRSFLGE